MYIYIYIHTPGRNPDCSIPLFDCSPERPLELPHARASFSHRWTSSTETMFSRPGGFTINSHVLTVVGMHLLSLLLRLLLLF